MIIDLKEKPRVRLWRSWRVALLVNAILLSFGCLLAGAVALQLYQEQFLEKERNKRYERVIRTQGERGVIWDRTGRPLAASAPVFSIHVNPVAFREWAEKRTADGGETAIAELARELGKPAGELLRVLSQDRRFAYLRHHLSPEEAESVRELRIGGIGMEQKFTRFYPSDYLAAQVVGFTNYKNEGAEGIERSRDRVLRQASGQRRVLRTARQEVLEEFDHSPPIDGNDIDLTMDLRLQFLAYLALEKAVSHHQAKSGSVVLLDALDGSIIAMASYPTYNPNTRTGDPSSRRSRALQDVFEPGSTMKPLVAAMAIEHGLVTPSTVLPTSKPLRYGKYVIDDEKIREDLTVADTIMRSSNVGAVSMVEMLPSDLFWQTLHDDFGFGRKVGIDFPGAAAGLLRHHEDWYPVDKATHAYGYGLSISLLHLARAYLVFANDGFIPALQLIEGEDIGKERRVFSRQTMDQVVAMMERVVTGERGTAPRAAVPGYLVAGKTGTTYKNRNGQYSDKGYQSLFVGLAPASDPRFVAAVFIDEPTRNGYYGGTVAAPVFSELMEHALRLYAVDSDAPLAEVEVASAKGN